MNETQRFSQICWIQPQDRIFLNVYPKPGLLPELIQSCFSSLNLITCGRLVFNVISVRYNEDNTLLTLEKQMMTMMETQAIIFFLQFAAVLGKTNELRTYFVWDKSPRVRCFNPTKLTLYISAKFHVYICFIQWNKCINFKNSHCKKKQQNCQRRRRRTVVEKSLNKIEQMGICSMKSALVLCQSVFQCHYVFLFYWPQLKGLKTSILSGSVSTKTSLFTVLIQPSVYFAVITALGPNFFLCWRGTCHVPVSFKILLRAKGINDFEFQWQ